MSTAAAVEASESEQTPAFSLELSRDQREVAVEGTSEIQRLVIARAISGLQIA